MIPRFGTPGFACSAMSAATESGSSVNGPRDHSDTRPNATRSESTAVGPQCAGWVTASASGSARPSVTAEDSARDASATNVSLRCVVPSATTTSSGLPTRSTKTLITTPGSLSIGFSNGTPTSGGRCQYKVSTGLRVTARSAVTAAKLVAPTERPNADRSTPAISSNPRASATNLAALLANRANPRDQRQIERGDPARRKIVDGRHRVERAHPGGQAAGGGRVASGAVGEPKRCLLGDARRALDVDPIDVVFGACRPVRCGVKADAVHMLELNAGLALVDPVDGEPDRGHMSGRDDALGRLALVGCHPLVPRGGDLVEHDPGGVRDHRPGAAPCEDQHVLVFQHRAELGLASNAHLDFVVAFVVGVVQQL